MHCWFTFEMVSPVLFSFFLKWKIHILWPLRKKFGTISYLLKETTNTKTRGTVSWCNASFTCTFFCCKTYSIHCDCCLHICLTLHVVKWYHRKKWKGSCKKIISRKILINYIKIILLFVSWFSSIIEPYASPKMYK